MNLEALPLALVIVLAEFSAGSLAAVLFSDGRALAPASFVKLSAAIVAIGAGLAVLAAFAIDTTADVEGYALRESLYTPVRVALIVFAGLTLPYAWLAFGERRQPSLVAGGVAAVAGIAALGLLAALVSAPAWSYAGVLLSLLAGAATLGLVTEAMILGHWYLVTPKLPSKPLEELTLALLIALVVQGALIALNAAVPAGDPPATEAALAGSLGTNPAFWLRVCVGWLFPTALAYMAWQSSREQAMMSATGLLYIAVGAVFAGELLARGLLFVTGSPV
jgi:hypothetical protein